MRTNKKLWGSILVVFLLILSAFANSEKTPNDNSKLLLKNAMVINPKTMSVAQQDLLIEGDKIVSVAPNINKTGIDSLDLSGKYIVPGFIDAHIHPVGNAGANQGFEYLGIQGTVERALQSGVVAVLDVFSNESENINFRNTQNKAKGADFFTSGSCFTSTNGHCTEYQVPTRTIDTPEQAMDSVRDLIETKNPDIIKIVYDNAYSAMPTIDEPTMKAAIRTANSLGVKTMVHIGTWENARKALQAGATSITHTFCKPIPDDVIELMIKKNAYFIPTLVVQKDLLAKVKNPKIWTDALAKRVIPEAILSEYLDTEKFNPGVQGFLAYQQQCSGHLLLNVKKAWDAGVKVLTGTDIPNSGTFVGYSVHREMDLFAEAGISNWEILRSSTTYSSEFLSGNYGVSPGNLASLVILNSSPIEDIANTKDIYKVIHRGNPIDLNDVN